MSTPEFAARWQAALTQAQQVYRGQQEAVHQELERRRDRAEELLTEVAEAFTDAAAGGSGIETQPASPQPRGLEGHLLVWKATEPTRTLVVLVQRRNGQAYYALVQGQNPPVPQLREFDVLRFTAEHLEELMLGLADQAAWGEKRVPEVILPEPDPEAKLRLDQLQRDFSSQSQAQRLPHAVRPE
jgi:hypothetical protein